MWGLKRRTLLTGHWKLLAGICRCRQLHLHAILLRGVANLWDGGHASGTPSETWRTKGSSQSVQHDQGGWWEQPSKILYTVKWLLTTRKGNNQFPIPSTHGKEKLERPSTSDPKLTCSHSANLRATEGKDISHKSVCLEYEGTYSPSEIISEEIDLILEESIINLSSSSIYHCTIFPYFKTTLKGEY